MIPTPVDMEGIYCPMCQCRFRSSDYLASVISDQKALWIANMVTHYRHDHVQWDRTWRYMSRKHPMWDYDSAKKNFNERAKRQIIRKAKHYLMYHGINSHHFDMLQHNDPATISLARAVLDVHSGNNIFTGDKQE